ncbi:actin-binding protein IPP-like [Ischnura elegans]|uniref:actin-binding protein IPP-like n=1 Tax=Ischnura elegans TaxID=197161 RepID=UPI001ED8B3EA|nr:actin-binding protein IPP-like [Ischnura elegans]
MTMKPEELGDGTCECPMESDDRSSTQQHGATTSQTSGQAETSAVEDWKQSGPEESSCDEFGRSLNTPGGVGDVKVGDLSEGPCPEVGGCGTPHAVASAGSVAGDSSGCQLPQAEADGTSAMETSCHLGEGETFGDDAKGVGISGGVQELGVEDSQSPELPGKSDSTGALGCTSDSSVEKHRKSDVDSGSSKDAAADVVQETSSVFSSSEANSSFASSEPSTSSPGSSHSGAKLSLDYKNEAIVLKCNPKKSKAMMSIRRQHSDKVMRNLDQMRKENLLCDVELEAAGGKIFKAHRSVLVAACSYFRAMFSSGLLEGKESRVKMLSLSPQTMSTMLQFIYSGELQVGLDEVQELMVVADMLQMGDVIDGCTQLMHDEIDPSNALGIYRFAEAHNCTAMSKMSECFVKQNFVEVVKGEEFLDLPLNILTFFLSSEGLEVDSEMQVFESAVRWLFHDPPNRRQHVFEVLRHVRLGLLHPDLMSLRASSTLGGDPPLGVALASIRMEVEERARRQHSTGHEDVPRLGAKKRIVVLGGCRREPVPAPYRSAVRCSSHPGEVLCAAVEVFDVFHKEWYGQGSSPNSQSAVADSRGPPPLLHPRILPGVAALGGIIYVVGGELESQILANGRRLDPIRWMRVSSMVVPRCEFGLCTCAGKLYAIGGWVGSDVDSSVESYDPIADEWRLEGNLPKSCSGVGAISYEGLIYVLGGCTRHRRHLPYLLCLVPPGSRTHSRQNPNPSWCSEPVRLAPMRTPRSQMGVAILHDSLYAVGGTNGGSDALRSVERYSFAENKWYEVAPLREGRSTPAVVALDGRLYAIGGTSSFHMYHYQAQVSLRTVEMYDPVTDMWTSMPSLPHARGEAGAVVV